MLSAIGLAQPTLRIDLEEEMIYLNPSETSPSEDPSLWGKIELFLPKPKTLKSLTVRLVGEQTIGWPQPRQYEETRTLDKSLSLIPEGEEAKLAAGNHTFTFSIIVPSSTPSHERCQWGRVRHTIYAKAKGLGALGGDVVAEETQLFLINNPGGAGHSIPPPPLNERMDGTHEDIGPYCISLDSQHIMVGGLLLLRFSLPSPPSTVRIHSLKVLINQQYHLQSPSNPSLSHTTPVEPRTVLILSPHWPANNGVLTSRTPSSSRSSSPFRSRRDRDELAFAVCEKGEKWEVRHLAPLPIDQSLRASTPMGSDSGIKVKHWLAFEMSYSVVGEDGEEGEKKLLGLQRELVIHSCCCLIDSLMLPKYSVSDPYPDEPANRAPPCICELPFEEVWPKHSEFMKNLGVEGTSVSGARRSKALAGFEMERGRSF